MEYTWFLVDPKSWLLIFRRLVSPNGNGYLLCFETEAAAKTYAREHGLPDVPKNLGFKELLVVYAAAVATNDVGVIKWMLTGARLTFVAVEPLLPGGALPAEAAELSCWFGSNQ